MLPNKRMSILWPTMPLSCIMAMHMVSILVLVLLPHLVNLKIRRVNQWCLQTLIRQLPFLFHHVTMMYSSWSSADDWAFPATVVYIMDQLICKDLKGSFIFRMPGQILHSLKIYSLDCPTLSLPNALCWNYYLPVKHGGQM